MYINDVCDALSARQLLRGKASEIGDSLKWAFLANDRSTLDAH